MADIQDFEQRKPQSLVVRLPGLWLYCIGKTTRWTRGSGNVTRLNKKAPSVKLDV